MMFPDKKPLSSYTHILRSRYGETDQMGYVYYGRYLEYFEVARTEMIRALGLPYKKMENEGIMLPVIHAEVDYHSPLFYDEELHIAVTVYDKPVVKLDTWYKIYTERSEIPHATGRVTLCFMDRVKRKPCRAPGYFLDRIEKISGT